jgi:hypothetical protein
MFENETQVAWRAMPYRAPVVSLDGSGIGTAESLLGDDDEDIFLVEIAAPRINKITKNHVITDLSTDDVAALPPYREEHWFHLGWGGLFRKHPEWEERR